MDQSAPVRLARVLVVTALVVCLAAAGHLAGGGSLPSGPALLGCTAPVLLLGRVCERSLSLPRLLTVLGAAQVALHEAFTVLSTPGSCTAATAHPPASPVHGSGDGLGHGSGHNLGHGSEHIGGGAAGCWDVLAAAHHAPSATGALMLAGHAAAVVTTALALARIETALRHLVAWLRPLTTLPAPAALPAGSPRPPLPPAEPPATAWWGPFRLRVRGPPALEGA